jgi:Meckel syndrome type 1 protein
VVAAARGDAGVVVAAVAAGSSPGPLLAHAAVLFAIKMLHPGLGVAVAAAAVVAPAPDALAALLPGPPRPPSHALPPRLLRAVTALAAAAPAAAALAAARAARRAARRPPPRPTLRRTISTSIAALRAAAEARETEGAAGPPRAPSPDPAPTGSSPTPALDAAALASSRGPELDELRAALDAAGVRLRPGRFKGDGAELARFAAAAGLLDATSPEAAAAALDAAAGAIIDAEHAAAGAARARAKARGRRRRPTPTPGPPAVEWAGVDPDGRPVLLLRACVATEAGPAGVADAAAAVLAAVDAWVAGADARPSSPAAPSPALADAAPAASSCVAVVDAAGVEPLAATRAARAVRETAAALAARYPHRLAALAVVGLPPALAWMLPAVMAGLPPGTVARVACVDGGDGAVPACARAGARASVDGPRRATSAPPRFADELEAGAGLALSPLRPPRAPFGGDVGDEEDPSSPAAPEPADPSPRLVRRVSITEVAPDRGGGKHAPSPRAAPGRSALRRLSRFAAATRDGLDGLGADPPARAARGRAGARQARPRSPAAPPPPPPPPPARTRPGRVFGAAVAAGLAFVLVRRGSGGSGVSG